MLEPASPVPDRLASIESNLGQGVTIEYTPSTTYQNTQLPYPVQTVSSITTDDGNGTSSTTEYEFSGGFHHIGERDFRGFNYAKVTGPLGENGEQTTSETWFHQGGDVAVGENNPNVEDGYTKGKPYRKRISDQNGNMLSEISTIYAEDDDGFAPYFTPIEQVDTSVCDGDFCGLQTRTVYEFDSYGNLVTEQRYGDISTDTDDSTLIKEYALNESSYIVGLLAKETLYDGANTKRSQVEYFYDGPRDCSSPATNQVPIEGNLSRIVRWLDNKTAGTPSDAEARMGYDSYGNLVCSIDANGNKTTTIYDSSNTFPVREVNSLLQETTTSYYGVDGVIADNGLYGQVKTVTDPNEASTTIEYDGFGRKTLETLSDGSWQSWSYNDFGTVGSQHVLTNNSFGLWGRAYFDGLGRTYEEHSIGADNNVVVTQTKYDARGKEVSQTLPYFSGDENIYEVSTDYDAVGRPVAVTQPDGGTSQFCYNDDVTVSIDANHHRRRETHDSLGQLTKVEEYLGEYTICDTDVGTPYATTNYYYDVLGHLTHVVDTKGNQTQMVYDSLGRKIYMNDPDMGEWNYDYDTKGNLVTQWDAKGQVISYAYDALDRVTQKNYSSQNETDIAYYYDEANHGYALGKLTRMVDASGVASYHYNDPLDRSVTMTRTIDGNSYNITTTADALGRTQSVQYPDNTVTGYVYSYGLLQSVTDGTINYATYKNYNAQGQAGQISYANGVTTDYTYEAENNILSTIQVNKGSTRYYDNDYQYDLKGNITEILNFNNGNRSQVFSYDALDRLKIAASGMYGNLSYSYDEIGNIVTKDGLTYTPDTQRPHAVGSITGGRDFSYDANGNMLSDGLRTYVWNDDNKPRSIVKDGITTDFIYDGNGQRIKKTVSPVVIGGAEIITHYIGQLYEITSNTAQKFIMAYDKRLAVVRHSSSHQDVLYFHQDHLGSTGVMTNELGTVVKDIFYKPFGETVSESGIGGISHKFTGQELDSETELYNYNARLYDPEIGRFLSADILVPYFNKSQSFNRYSYVRNNPLRYNDPTGHWDDQDNNGDTEGFGYGKSEDNPDDVGVDSGNDDPFGEKKDSIHVMETITVYGTRISIDPDDMRGNNGVNAVTQPHFDFSSTQNFSSNVFNGITTVVRQVPNIISKFNTNAPTPVKAVAFTSFVVTSMYAAPVTIEVSLMVSMSPTAQAIAASPIAKGTVDFLDGWKGAPSGPMGGAKTIGTGLSIGSDYLNGLGHE